MWTGSRARIAAVAALFGLTNPSIVLAQQKSPAAEPIVTVLSHSGGVVAADHPLASATGARVLAGGGSAADAAVATLLTLGVVNPFASGLGGGGFCMVRDAASGKVRALDFREVAPKAATATMFLDKKTREPIRKLSREGGLAVGVPGEAAGLEALHKAYGKLPWRRVVQPALDHAARGFYVGELLPTRLAYKQDALRQRAKLAAAFESKPGQWVKAQDMLRRPELAKTLTLLRDKGAAGFYTGPVAEAIVSATRAEGGILTAEDLKGYAVDWREPLQATYRGHQLYLMPSPSSGGLVMAQALHILEGYDLKKMGWGAEAVHLIVEALKHAFANRARWMGDADFVKVPVARLISRKYAATLRAKIDPKKTFGPEHYGSARPPRDDDGTSHVSIIDRAGNMVACTSTVNTTFGSMVYTGAYGLVLNNEMDDFTAKPGATNAFGLVGTAQNAVAPGKRPLSSMSPTLVLKDGKPRVIVGASGGPTIITGTLLALLRVLDFGQSPRDAIVRPRIHHQWMPHKLFIEPGDAALIEGLKTKGHDVSVRPAFNSVQMIVIDGKGDRTGVSDPRKRGRPAKAP